MQSTDEGSFGRPKSLVVYFTKNAAPQTPRYPSVVKPVSFPYQSSHAVPWRYAPPSERKEEATDISSLLAKVTNITGLSNVTHSSRVFAPPDLPTQPANVKGKAKIAEEQNDKMIPTLNENIPVKGLSEKKNGCGKKEVSLEEAGEFNRYVPEIEPFNSFYVPLVVPTCFACFYFYYVCLLYPLLTCFSHLFKSFSRLKIK